MRKGYWIARMDVTDAARYGDYIASAGPVFSAFGGRFLVRGGESTAAEGLARSRNVVIEFPSYRKAVDCYNSTAYREAQALRSEASTGEIVIVEGYEA